MTQAFNLSQFANKLNSSGQTDNTGLQNSSVTVTAGSGMSGGGAVSLGGSVTLTNAGVTSVAAGTGISVSASTGGVTITNTSSASGTVTSVATGNGLSGGTITTSGTLTVACPTLGTVGSYAMLAGSTTINQGSNYSGKEYAGIGTNYGCVPGTRFAVIVGSGTIASGTWKAMGYASSGVSDSTETLFCRVS